MYSVLSIIGFPVLYVLVGTLVPPKNIQISRWIANFLYFFCIPVVTFNAAYTMDVDSFVSISLATFIFSCLATVLSMFVSSTLYNVSTKAVLTGYINIGWFGIPVAYALFGVKGANVMVAAYMGGNVFGSTIAVYLIASNRYNPKQSLMKVLQNPAFYALGLGFLGKNHINLTSLDTLLFSPTRVLLSFLGMCLIGIVMRRYFPVLKNIHVYTSFVLTRLCVVTASVLIVIASFYFLSLLHMDEVKILGLIAVFPIAANIIVIAEALKDQIEKFVGALIGSTILSFTLVLLGTLFLT